MTKSSEMIEIICPKCKRTQIFNLGKEEMPKCEVCAVRMVVKEVLREGKAF